MIVDHGGDYLRARSLSTATDRFGDPHADAEDGYIGYRFHTAFGAHHHGSSLHAGGDSDAQVAEDVLQQVAASAAISTTATAGKRLRKAFPLPP